MNKFERFNNIEIDYEEIKLNDLEMAKAKNIAKNYIKRKNSVKIIISIVSVFILFIISSTIVQGYYKNIAEETYLPYSENRRVEPSVDNYSTDIYKTFTLGDEFYVFQNIFVDENIVNVNILQAKKPKIFPKSTGIQIMDVKYNGESLPSFGLALGKDRVNINEKSYHLHRLSYFLSEPLPSDENLDLEIVIRTWDGDNEYFENINITTNTKKYLDEFITLRENIDISRGDEKLVVNEIKLAPTKVTVDIDYPNKEKYPTSYKLILSFEGEEVELEGDNITLDDLKFQFDGWFIKYDNENKEDIDIKYLKNHLDEVTFQLYKYNLEDNTSDVEKVGIPFKIKN